MFARRTQKTNQIQPVPDVTVAEMSLAAREALRSYTPARLGLERTGVSLATRPLLDFQLAHARARDAVHAPLDTAALAGELAPLPTVFVTSAAGDRGTYLRRPDLGRMLASGSGEQLAGVDGGHDVAIVIGDGLSATGVQTGAAQLVRALVAELDGLTLAPIVIATGARVALGDAIGEILRARATIMVIGERPGLTVADSLGIYLTFGPRLGRADSERNCISNIHANGGLSPAQAASLLGRLLREALRRGLSGVDLKDDADALPAPDSFLIDQPDGNPE